MTENTRKAQLEVGLDASGFKRGAQDVADTAQKLGRDVQQAGAGAGKAFEGIGQGAEQASQKADRATKRLIDSIQRTTVAAEAGGRSTAAYYETLANQKGINADALRPYLDRLRQVEKAQVATGQAMQGTEISARQMQNALRGVPAQFTDIATSLASGQQPLTVFLQQGGQLKDMFGGAGPAARALGGYIAGLINPLTVAAAAAGGLFLAWKAGGDEITRLNQAVILSGQQLGLTAGYLQDVAASVAAVGAGTQGAATEFLQSLAANARVGAGDLERFTAAALNMARVGGPAVEDSAKAFAELGREPLKASLKLTEQYNYLTKATYEQIKALEDVGRNTEAAAIAQNAYFDFLDQRVPQMEAQLNSIGRAWLYIKKEAASAIGALKGIGRDDTATDQLAKVREQINELQKAGQTRYVFGPTMDELRQREANLQETLRLQSRSAELDGQRASQVRAITAWDKESDKYLTKRVQMERELARVRKLGQDAGKDPADVAKLEREIRAKYAERRASGSAGDPFAADRAAAKDWADAYQRFASLAGDAEGKVQGLSRAQGELVQYLQSPAYQAMAEPARQLVLQQAYAAIGAEQLAAAQKESAKISAEAAREYTRWLEEMQRGAQQVDKQAQALRDEAAAQALVIPGYRSLEQAIVMVEIARLRERQAAVLGNEDAVLAIEREIQAREKLIAEIAKRDTRKAAEEANKATLEEWRRTTEKISDSLTDALMRGFEDGKGFARNLRDTVVNMFRTMVLRPVVQAIVNPVAAVLGGGLGASGSAAANITGQAGGAGSVAQSVQQLYSAISGSFSKIGTDVAMAADRIGEWLVTNTTGTLNRAGGTLMEYAGQIGAGAEVVAGAAAGMGLRRAVGRGYEISSGYSTFQDIGVAVASAIGGPVMGAIAGAVAGLVNRAFGRGPKTAYEQGIEGTFGAGDATGMAYSDWIKKGGWFRSDKRGTDRTPWDADMSAALDAGASAVLQQTTAWAAALQLPADRLGEITSSFKIKFTDDAEANKAAIADAINGYGATLAEAYGDILRPLQKFGENLGDTLGRVSTLQVFSENLNELGGVFSRVAGLGIDVRESFISMAGGMDALMANAMGFVQNYYSREEIAGLKGSEIQRALLDAGIANAGQISSRADFRALVDGTDVSTEAGRQQLATLLSLSGAFVSVADYMAETGSSLAQVAAQAPESGSLASLISPMQQQTDATNLLTDGMGALRSSIDRMIDILRNGGQVFGNAGQAAPVVARPPEVDTGDYMAYFQTQGGA